MTNDKAIERIKAFRDYLCGGNPIWDVDECREAFDIALAAMEQKWTPVSEGLPEYKMQVLTIDKDGDYELNHIVDEEDGEWYWGHPIAWMPLPEPWEGEE